MTSKKLSEFTAELTELNENTDRVLVARPGNATDYFCTPATIAALAAGGGGDIQIVSSEDAPDVAPQYDGTTGISFYVRVYSLYGSPVAELYFGADTTGTNFDNGWQMLQNN